MVRLNDHMKLSASLQLVGHYIISFIFVVFTQFAISLVPRFFPSSPFFIQLTLLALVLLVVVGFGRWSRWILRVYASAPAIVFFNILFIWTVYVAIIRQAVSSLIDALFNGQIAVIVIGFCRILLSDPGRVTQESLCSDRLVESSDFGVEPGNKGSPSHRRVRYCKRCKAHIKGFDHHCPAYGNCIGENNYVLFIALLLGFLSAEASYVVCSVQFVRKIQRNDTDWSEINVFGNLAISTMLFSILQILWQGVFLTWHLYCVCFNIRTDEWINWMKYPEFQLVQSEPGTSFTRVEFRNPYDKGVLQNVKELLAIR
ncbi:palmitoyltransferase ZDHHC12-like isoform X2 [Mangifera indica]|uniref:palmitoyltransferase ZDHHC12-like isoform X2 n=1 Tax=Mangifera indica TaxID=29780 RepID=UPI001CF9E382|nr:palmitoyltransferase ZDHHC12-like isoform X2 [Mangifera indica]